MQIRIEKTTNPKAKPDQSNLGFGKIFTDHMFIMNYTEGKGWHDARIVPYENISLAPLNNDFIARINEFQNYMRQLQELRIKADTYAAIPNIDSTKYFEAQMKLGNTKLNIQELIIKMGKIYFDHSQELLQMLAWDVQNKRPQRVYGVNGFNNGQALLNNVKPGKYIVSVAGTIQNIRFTWIFAVEKIEGQPLYINLTNNQDCLINE